MIETKHTRGPWSAVAGNDHTGSPFLAVVGPGNLHIVGWDLPYPEPEDYANARLIAAAPDLLEACEAAYYMPTVWVNDPDGRIADGVKREVEDLLRNAICKAKAVTHHDKNQNE